MDVELPATTGGVIALDGSWAKRLVLFVYPRTGDPGHPDSAAWAKIPGAKGCTAEACSFRDLRDDFAALGWGVAGCSTQGTDYQAEAARRLHLPYPLLSDRELRLGALLGLRTFEFDGAVLYRRITLLIEGGVVVDVVDPGDDPTGHVESVLEVVLARDFRG